MDTWPWCMSMFGARFAVFVRRARVLPTPCPATRNLSFLRFHRRRDTVVSTCCFTGMVRVGVKIPQDGNRANKYKHVAMVHVHVWRTVCSVCATGARVARPVAATRNLSFLRFHRHRHPVVSTRCFTGNGTGWCENSTRWKPCKPVKARGGGA